MRKPEKVTEVPIDLDDTHFLVDVIFYYYPGFKGVYNPPHLAEPPEPESIEILQVLYNSGIEDEVDQIVAMGILLKRMEEDDDFHAALELAIWERLESERSY